MLRKSTNNVKEEWRLDKNWIKYLREQNDLNKKIYIHEKYDKNKENGVSEN